MQHILYHNSSGRDAFTGNLKVKEVHRAMTLHPVKRHKYMYRIHNYMRGLKIHDLQQDMLNKHRDIYAMLRLLGGNLTSMEKVELSHNSPLFANGVGEEDYLGDPYLLGKEPGLLKPPLELIPWNFVSRSIYSPGNLNPRKKLESHIKEGLDDVIREVMENLNTFSRERGRMIDFQELLYGYYRENPLHGADYILDLLLVYKKYRGRKMTVPVRKHAYVQQQFTGLEIREMVEDLASTELRPPSTSAEETAAVNSDDVIYDTMARNQGRRSKRQKKTVINFIMGE
ncbi:chondroitin sulfate synthase 1-like, partial [Diaphorina citri]|uniref:Hexosyltransferase n=1 Tax=Diaphorina citri TaxID=121845 RepID=A0A1S3DGU7_DIACI